MRILENGDLVNRDWNVLDFSGWNGNSEGGVEQRMNKNEKVSFGDY